jgi:16S rRNA (cytidine1402-2'-O)-methyltransferase
LGERQIIVARELTKLHEQIVRTTARAAPQASIPEKGEFTIVLGPASASQDADIVDDNELSAFFDQMTDERRSRRQAVVATAVKFGLSPNDVYARLERLKPTRPS